MRHTELIKINLPLNDDDYIAGTGEGVFAKIDKDTKLAYDLNEDFKDTNAHYYAILDNNSSYYPKLEHGTMIPIELHGKNRPVVPYLWLKKYKEV